jgi:hypothetical protein
VNGVALLVKKPFFAGLLNKTNITPFSRKKIFSRQSPLICGLHGKTCPYTQSIARIRPTTAGKKSLP